MSRASSTYALASNIQNNALSGAQFAVQTARRVSHIIAPNNGAKKKKTAPPQQFTGVASPDPMANHPNRASRPASELSAAARSLADLSDRRIDEIRASAQAKKGRAV